MFTEGSISKELRENLQRLDGIFENCMDYLCKRFQIGETEAALLTVDGLVDKLYEFRDGKVTEHLGTVADFLRRRKLESLSELERRAPAPEKAQAQPSEGVKEFRKMKAVSKEERKIRNRIDYLEKQISAHEEKMAEIEKILANPGNNDDILDLTREYLEHKRTMDEETLEWTSLMEQIDN